MIRVTLPESWRSRAIVIGDAVFSDDWFTAEELEQVAAFHLEKRRTEWKHSRIAAKQLAIELKLCDEPHAAVIRRPRLVIRHRDANRFVSFSHSGGYAAAAIDTAPVGVDVEKQRLLREDAAHLFLTDDETAQMRGCSIANRMLHFWSAKEAVWKQLEGVTETLKRTPIQFESETASGLLFREVETFATGEILVALTRPTSAADSSRR